MRYGSNHSQGEAKMRAIMLAAGVFGLCACATASEPALRTAQAQATYDRLLTGKIAGKAERCLPAYRSNDMTIVDEDTILFRDGRTVYVNHPPGGCSNADRGGRALVTKTFNAELCRGDLATVVDSSTGMMVGACALGDFIPYRGS